VKTVVAPHGMRGDGLRILSITGCIPEKSSVSG
jgi:hypothetical protein